MAKSGRKKTLHDLSREFPSDGDVGPLIGSLAKMDARGAALIIGSILDNYLEHAFAISFVPLSETKFNALFRDKQAPLSSFSSKITVAYALGIFNNEIRSQLDRIQSIRNAFAHTMQSIDFDYRVIADECNKLSPSKITGRPFDGKTSRDLFLGSATIIGIAIVSYINDKHLAIEEKREAESATYECRFC